MDGFTCGYHGILTNTTELSMNPPWVQPNYQLSSSEK